ncbi:hypothetical protein [Halopseudomonas bauzanensis]|uniref:hypothetical protein n=1 Tax=Halopseudomonas bauzanensis TaxID=653930 RepID=UPI002555D14C|nr:hypothetical protein [Halopseudomonas bauzanensis]
MAKMTLANIFSAKSFFSFRSLSIGRELSANVYIHGYSAAHSLSDKLALGHHVSADIPGSVNIFAYWESGHLIEKLKEQSISLLPTLTRPSPLTIGSGLAQIGYKSLSHFLEKRKYAEVCGKHLLAELEEYLLKHHGYVERVNLIGHSLGGRLLVSALQSSLEQARKPDRRNAKPEATLEIQNVLLMAAATELSERDSAVLTNAVTGNIYHAYSKSDSVLLLNPLEKSIGRREVKYFKSTQMTKPDGAGFGHMDYWPNLNQVLVETGFFSDWAPCPPSEQIRASGLEGFTHEDIELVELLARSPWRALKVVCAITGVASSGKAPQQVATNIAKRIKEAGGNIAANRYRGHGVSYAETLEDTWEALTGRTRKKHVSLDKLESDVCALIINIALQGQKTESDATKPTLSESIKNTISISRHLRTSRNFVFINNQSASQPNTIKNFYMKCRKIPNNLWHMDHFKLLPAIYLIHHLRGQKNVQKDTSI